ncbi:MAG: hypothetical protein ACKVJ2_12725, partial [Pseudomonadales bacterium]
KELADGVSNLSDSATKSSKALDQAEADAKARNESVTKRGKSAAAASNPDFGRNQVEHPALDRTDTDVQRKVGLLDDMYGRQAPQSRLNGLAEVGAGPKEVGRDKVKMKSLLTDEQRTAMGIPRSKVVAPAPPQGAARPQGAAPPQGAAAAKKESVGGGGGQAIAGVLALQAIPGIIDLIAGPVDETSGSFRKVTQSATGMITGLGSLVFSLQAFGLSLDKNTVGSFLKGGGGKSVKGGMSSLGKRLTMNGQDSSGAGFLPHLDIQDRTIKKSGMPAKMSRGAGALVSGTSNIAGALTAVAGPLTVFAGGLVATSTLLSALQDNLGQYNKAVESGNSEKAQELAVSKEMSGIGNAMSGSGVAAFALTAAITAAAAALAIFAAPLIGVGAGIAALVGGLLGLGASLGFLNEMSVRQMFGGDGDNLLKARAKSEAITSRNSLDGEKNNKDFTKLTSDIEVGKTTATKSFSQKGSLVGFSNTNELATAKAQEARQLFDKGSETAALEGDVKIKEANSLRSKAIEDSKPFFAQLGKEASARGSSKSEFKTLLETRKRTDTDSTGLSEKQIEDLVSAYGDQNKAIQENMAYMKALNFGLRDVIATSIATAVSMEGLLQSTQVGSNPFEQSIANIQSAMSNVASEMSADTLLDTRDSIASSLKDSGANDKQVESTLGTFDLISNVARNSAGAFNKLKTDRRDTNVGDQKLLEDLGRNLSIGKSPEQAKKIQDIATKLDLSDPKIAAALDTGSFGEVADAIQKELVGAFGKDLIQIQEARKRQEAVLINLTTQKIALQTKEIDAIQKSVAIRLNSLDTIAEFTGNRASGDKKKTLLA